MLGFLLVLAMAWKTQVIVTYTALATVLTSGTTATAGGSAGRRVHAQWSWPAVTNGTNGLTVQCETGVGTGVYDTVATLQHQTGVAVTCPTTNDGWAFWVPTGRRYKWTNVGAGSSMVTHNYTEE